MAIRTALQNMNLVQVFKDAFGSDDITPNEIKSHILEAYGMYYNAYYPDGYDCNNYDSSLRLPFVIVNKLKKTVFGEYQSDVDGEGQTAEIVKDLQAKLDRVKAEAFQQGAIAGTALIKPIITPDGIDFTVIHRPNYIVLSRDFTGRVNGIGSMDTAKQDEYTYYLLEERRVDYLGRLTIKNKLYRTKTENVTGAGYMGEPVLLGSAGIPEQYQRLLPEFTLPIPVGSIGMAPFDIPNENPVCDSPDKVSLYAPAIPLIHQINKHESMFYREFGNAESKVFASDDLFKRDENGRKRLEDDLYVKLDEDPEQIGITIYSPQIRHESYLARKNDYLRACETLIGFQRGILSEVEAVERTATQITDSAGDYNLTIVDLQGSWALTNTEAIRTAVILGQIYHNWPQGDYPEPALDFGDGVLFDRNKTYTEYLQLVSSGLLKPEIFIAWYFNRKPKNDKEWADMMAELMPDLSEQETEEGEAE